MTYTPNFTHSKVKKKITRALGFALTTLSTEEPRAWARVTLDKFIGYQHHALGKWLRKTLLVEHSGRWNKDTGECKKWLLNEQGVRYICELYNLSTHYKLPIATLRNEIGVEWADQQFKEALTTGNFEYQEKSFRLWHEAQRIPSSVRKRVFANNGYEYEYDIRCAAPTLIKQLAVKEGLTKPTPELDAYLNDRQKYRQALAERVGITEKQSKEILTALFCGAKLGPRNSIMKILGNDFAKDQLLRQLTWLSEFRKDISECWKAIKKANPTTRMTAKNKWMMYFELENQVMKVVRNQLKKESVRYFLEHDGWRCDSYIDVNSLRLLVRNKTGYSIEFEYEKII
jgi:hypothetical protein